MKHYKIPTINEIDIEFRTMSAEESDKFYFLLKQQDNPSIEEHIFNTITEFKYKDLDLDAGIIPLVVYTSFKLSGVITKKEEFIDLIDKYRDSVLNNNYYAIYAKIISTQPSYTLDSLRQKSLYEIMELFALSELTENVVGKNIFDTKQIREAFKQEELQKKNPTTKKGVKGISKEMLDSLKIALQTSDVYDPEEYL